MPKRGKNLQTAITKLEKGKRYEVAEAVKLVKELSFEKFDATVELAIRLNVDPRKADQNIRGAMVLPHGTGKTQTILVFAKGEQAKQAEEAGADFVGDSEMVAKVQGGWMDFDVVVATPNMMSEVGKLGRVLGPRGLMPNPKTGTVTMDVTKAISEIKAGKVEYRNDKVGNVQVPVGKVSFDGNKIEENIIAMYTQLMRIKPATVKGTYVQNISISSTMGPGIKLDADSLVVG
ncbi:50S ribosomal protein L1 [Mycoplasmatota bacterium]|nr:50S ribosomal protein L1 [Mycoplasmatota bacterium]